MTSAHLRARPAATALLMVLGALAACATGPSSATAPGGAATSEVSASDGHEDTATPAGPATVSLAFGGDVHFERQVASLLEDPDAVWAKRLPELAAADFAMVNLEAALTTRGVPEAKAYTFRVPPSSLAKLKAAGVDAVSSANNHAADYGRAGVQETLRAKSDGALPIVGFGTDESEAFAPLTVDIQGVRTAFLASSEVDEETARNWAAGPDSPGIATHLDMTRLRAAVVKAAAEHDLVVVFLHWGTEGSSCPNGQQAAHARALEADGADIVVGTHAHRPQGSGWMGRAFVGYGLGNFVWYNTSPASRSSGVLTVTVDAEAARARGRASGEARRTPASLVTEWTWTPKLISYRGAPETPGASAGHLADLARQAQACADLSATPPRSE